MPQSLASLNTLHLRNQAIFNKRYFADNGRVYIGTKDGKLKIEDKAVETSFSPTTIIQETNVQDAIENLSSGSNIGLLLTNTATIDFTYNSVVPASITADLKNTTVTAAVYGSATQSPTITIDAQGRITNAVNTAIAIAPGAIALTTNQILVGGAGNVAFDVAMSGEASIIAAGTVTLLNSAVIGKVLTGYVSGAGVLAATDTILQAFQKLNGNVSALVTGVSSVNLLTGAVALTGTANRITISAANVFDIGTDVVTLTGAQALSNKTGLISQWTNDTGYLTSVAITAGEIGFGSAGNVLTSDATFTWNNTAKDFTITGTIGQVLSNTANVWYVAQGNVGYWYTGSTSTGLLSHQGFGIDFKTNNKYTMGDVGITNNTHIEVNDTAQTITLTHSGTLTTGTIGSGLWNGSVISPVYGGTGVANNVASTLTISGAFASTLTVTGITGVTLPLSGTLYGTLANSITSAQLAASLTDETGTLLAVFSDSPTFTTQIIAPLIYGSSAVNGDLTLNGTSSATKTTSYINLQTTGGNVGIGIVAPLSILHTEVDQTDAVIYARSFKTTTAESSVRLGRAQGTQALPLTVGGTDPLASIYFQGYDGAAWRSSGGIQSIVNGAVSSGIVPGALIFYTTNTAGSFGERMRLDNAGNLGIGMTPVNKLDVTGTAGVTTSLTTPLIYGSTAANGDITIEGTSSATKTTSYVNLQTTGGNVGIGTTAPGQLLHLEQGTTGAGLTMRTFSITPATTNSISFLKGASNTKATYTATGTGDVLGEIISYGSDAGNSPSNIATKIEFIQTAAAGAANIPADMVFYTGTNSAAAIERVRITSAGLLGVGITPTSVLHLKAGTATANTAPLQFTSGTLETVARAGVMEYNGQFSLVPTDATRRFITLAASSTKTIAGAPYVNDGYITLNINGTDIKIMTTA